MALRHPKNPFQTTLSLTGPKIRKEILENKHLKIRKHPKALKG